MSARRWVGWYNEDEDPFGSLDPVGYEFEPGSTVEVISLYYRDTADEDEPDYLWFALKRNGHERTLIGRWLRIGADLAFELKQETFVNEGDWVWVGPADEDLNWQAGDSVEVSLWAENPLDGPVDEDWEGQTH